MRGAPGLGRKLSSLLGIIPAYAGSTCCRVRILYPAGDHPRVCGEHLSMVYRFKLAEGSSPRMRGAHVYIGVLHHNHRIIPAYAGSTRWNQANGLSLRDHPRVCGEHILLWRELGEFQGSSPRMRGAPCRVCIHRGSDRDHPRVCGEHLNAALSWATVRGSSPRMRGAPGRACPTGFRNGIIPAYAGSTQATRIRYRPRRDHPRVCGEHFSFFNV